MMQQNNNSIGTAIRCDETVQYPSASPFDPSREYPEFPDSPKTDEQNDVYDLVRQCLIDLQLDKTHLGTKYWMPFAGMIVPGNTVVIKPNLVLDTADPMIQGCTTTHPSVIRPVIDYCWQAMQGKGKIILGDACAAEANFEVIVERTGILDMVQKLQERGIELQLEDFRAVKVTSENGVWTGEQKNIKSENAIIVNLGESSMYYDERFSKAEFHGAGYNIKETNTHHHGSVQEYCVSKTILEADVVISIPKMKTHKKAGFTCCLKNLVGINADKNYLPHFSIGSVNMGGDEMPAISKKNIMMLSSYNWIRRHIISHTWRVLGAPATKLLRFLHGSKRTQHNEEPITQQLQEKTDTDVDLAQWFHSKLSGQPIAAGAWSGNYTICCMILDLNRIFLCCNTQGILQPHTNRKIFYIADGIIAGMGNGPTHPIPAEIGAVAAGKNGLAIDISLLRLFGIDENSIPLYANAKGKEYMHLGEESVCVYNGREICAQDRFKQKLIAPDGWEYKIL